MESRLNKAKGTNSRPTGLKRTRNTAYVGVCVALMAICSWISIPTVVPFTLQTFAVNLALILLGGKLGTLAITVFLLLALTGAPVLAGFTGGPGVVFGVTGGYLIGFLFIGIIYWIFTGVFGTSLKVALPAIIMGNVMMYFFGTVWFMMVYNIGTGAATFAEALAWCVLPFIPADIAKLFLAFSIGKVLTRRTNLFAELAD